LVGCRLDARNSLIIGIRKSGVHDGVIAVRPKAVVGFWKEQIFNEISGGIRPKYRCRPLGKGARRRSRR
jgi:hypothetical protein